MECQDGRDHLGNKGCAKRSRNGRYYYNSRLELAEGECIELQECIEQQKILLEEKEAKLQQKKRKVKDLSEELRKCKSRVVCSGARGRQVFLGGRESGNQRAGKDFVEEVGYARTRGKR